MTHKLWSMLALSLLATACQRHQGKPLLAFDNQIINVGNIKAGTQHAGKFVIRNTGSGELVLGEVTTDCQCTVAKFDNKNIQPGDSVWISYSVHPNIQGYFQQKIIIKNNTDSSNPAMFIVRGQVIQ